MPSASKASRPLPARISRASWSPVEMTRPRLYAECGATGVTTRHSRAGLTIGPPAEKLYAVDPVGVATTIASAA